MEVYAILNMETGQASKAGTRVYDLYMKKVTNAKDYSEWILIFKADFFLHHFPPHHMQQEKCHVSNKEKPSLFFSLPNMASLQVKRGAGWPKADVFSSQPPVHR